MDNNKIKITADSTCDIGQSLIKQLDVDIIGLIVTLGDKNYRDLQTIFPEDIYDFVEQHKILPKTAAPSPDDYRAFFAQFSQYQSVLHFNLSSKMSASNQNALIAAKEFENVLVIDSLSLSSGTALLMLEADRLRKTGASGMQIKAHVESLTSRVQASFVVDTLEYLHKGGRCSGLERLGAAILRLHPMLIVADGEIKVFKKLRGKMGKIYLEYIDILQENFAQPQKDFAFVTHTAGCNPEYVNAVRAKVKEVYGFKQIYTTVAGSTITSHCGAGTLGLLFINDTPIKA